MEATDQSQNTNAGTSSSGTGRRRPPTDAQTFLRRYSWKDLTEAERNAVNDCIGLATIRGGIGLGTTLTIAAVVSNMRHGKPKLPPTLRYGSLAFFSIVGSYIGLMSGASLYVKRILSVPNSKLADDLRTVIGDWQSRTLPPSNDLDLKPNEPLPQGEPGTGHGENEIIPRDPKVVRAEQRQAQNNEQTDNPTPRLTDRIGLTSASDRK